MTFEGDSQKFDGDNRSYRRNSDCLQNYHLPTTLSVVAGKGEKWLG